MYEKDEAQCHRVVDIKQDVTIQVYSYRYILELRAMQMLSPHQSWSISTER